MAISDTLPQRLRQARESLKLTLEQVSRDTGIGISSLSDFERGKREPSLSQLNKLAQCYHRSLSFFLSEEALPCETVLWRERPCENVHELESRFLRLCEQYRNLEIWCGEVVHPNLPSVRVGREGFSYKDARELATDTRRLLGLGDRPAWELLSTLEENGVKVLHQKFKPSGTAASAKSSAFGLAVLLNSNNKRWRRNFDLAHELFHLLVWDVFRKSPEPRSSVVADKKEEEFANVFATHLLMPEEAVMRAIDRRQARGSLEDLDPFAVFDIAREFDVSVEALLWRIHYLSNRGPEGVQRTREQIEKVKSVQSLLDRRQDTKPPRWPERYQALAVKALRRGEFSIGRFAEYLGISRNEAVKYLEQEPWECEEDPPAPA